MEINYDLSFLDRLWDITILLKRMVQEQARDVGAVRVGDVDKLFY
jgi:hypothetical protein